MKKLFQLTLIFSFIILSISNSYSIPLNGTYTIGNGGNYPTINSAVNDAENQGISGPVIFSILAGVYNDSIAIDVIPGSSSFNTLTLKSFSDNSSDVQVNIVSITGTNISIENLSINNSLSVYASYLSDINNINIINNDFGNSELYVTAPTPRSIRNINILGNINVGVMSFFGESWIVNGRIDTVNIKNNIVNRFLTFEGRCDNFLIENNTISEGLLYGGRSSFKIIKNRIVGRILTNGNYINNFIIGTIQNGSSFINNTIVGGSLDTPTVSGGYSFNNIIINPSGGAAFKSNSLSSDYNVYYNGGNSGLILNQGNTYNTVTDFYNATGLDQHSTSQPVSLVSPTDLHLAASSYGDPQLIGIPDTSVTDDIDGELRHSLYPFKGADEIVGIQVNLTLLIEGMYNSNFNQVIRKDSVICYLHQSSPPFNIIDSAISSIDTLSFSGKFRFINSSSGTYYISVKHFNSLETWSKTGGEYLINDGSIKSYDFTTSNTQAYGNNLKLKGSKYCVYSGDINDDSYINLSDLIPINNNASNFTTGNFLVTDLTGDNIVDLTDVSICYNNASNFISVIKP